MTLKATEILKLGFSKDIFRKNEKKNKPSDWEKIFTKHLSYF